MYVFYNFQATYLIIISQLDYQRRSIVQYLTHINGWKLIKPESNNLKYYAVV